MSIFIYLGALIVFLITYDILSDIVFSYQNPAYEEKLSAQRDKFGISEDTQESLIDDFGYPEYMKHLK